MSPVDERTNAGDRALLKKNNAIALAEKIIRLAKDHILMHMRFLDVSMAMLDTCAMWEADVAFFCDGKTLRYEPLHVIRMYKDEPGAVIRAYLHVLLHMVFCHPFRYEEVDTVWWDLACDMAVEHTVMEIGLAGSCLRADMEKKQILSAFSKRCSGLSAEKLYRYFRKNPLEPDELGRYERLFSVDAHGLWKQREQLMITLAEWKKLTRQLQTDLKSFSKGKVKSESLLMNLTEAAKERTDYEEFLKRFMVCGETMKVNDEEFDYIPYHYGMKHYGNMPLIEPLEYSEVQKVHDFVIALDTSASCSGLTVKRFLQKTYAIMKTAHAFFEEMNVHILQCDNRVQEAVVIKNQDDFDEYIRSGSLTGGGATDFRPVFQYVDDMQKSGELLNLKGLIYFTDGYGIFPQSVPDYETVFVFVREDDGHTKLPTWAVKIVLDEDSLVIDDSDGEWEDEY